MLFEYIEIFYNRKRRHSYTNYLSPSNFEEEMLQIEMAAQIIISLSCLGLLYQIYALSG